MTPARIAHAAAVAALYRSTAGDAPRGPIAGCDCGCISAEERVALQATKREHLAAEIVGHFAFKAMTTWGEPTDFRWFLPRVLELMAVGSVGAVDLELLARKAIDAGLPSWSDDARDAVTDAFFALWDVGVDRGSGDAGAIEAAVLVGVDVGMLLRHLEQRANAEAAAAEALAAWVLEACARRGGTRAAPLDAILRTATVDVVEELFFRYPEGDVGHALSRAREELGWIESEL